MGVFYPFRKITAVQSAPGNVQYPSNGYNSFNLPPGSQGMISPDDTASTQEWQINLTTESGDGSCTVQPIVSNDGVNWMTPVNIGQIAIASGPCPQSTASDSFNNWKFWSAYVTQISGTGASVTCLVNF